MDKINQSDKTPGGRQETRTEIVETIKFGEKTFETKDGFLTKYSDRCDKWVNCVKTQEGINELTDEHRKIVEVTQDYYKKNGIAPMIRILSKVTGIKSKRISELFPSGPGKMAGLPNAAGWARL